MIVRLFHDRGDAEMKQEIRIRPPVSADRDAWARLYAGYAAFYAVEQNESMRDRVWSWIHDQAHEVRHLSLRAQDSSSASRISARSPTRSQLRRAGFWTTFLWIAGQGLTSEFRM